MASMRFIAAASLLSLLGLGTSCRETTLVPPRSLDGPTAVAVSRGDVCLTTIETEARTIDYAIGPCPKGAQGAIGLVINERSDRLALLDLGLAVPRLVDLDPTTPGPNHLEVGRLPVDVAVSPDQTAAYTLNQLDRDVSIIDLRVPEVLPERYHLDETPIAMDVAPLSGEVVVAAGSPSKLFVFPGATTCADDASGDDFRCDVTPGDDESHTLALPGTVSDFTFSAAGDEAWVTYRDLNFASVVSFAATPDGFDTPCLDGVDSKPCVTAQVPLSFGCNDGLDNDGDGLVDQQDEQCWGPLNAESPAGLGRRPADACANGLDDDGDGFADREDPECMISSGISEEIPAFSEPPLTACNDGVDDDDDGRTDYPADPDCYGPLGRTEKAIRPVGFDAVGVGPHGVYVYVVDRANEQILVIDGRRKMLIDAPSSHLPSTDHLDEDLGVDVVPSPLSVAGAVERNVVYRDPDDDEHAVVRYDFGAWVSSNDGSLQYVDTVVSFCEVTGEEIASDAAFRRGELGALEARCLQLPALPLDDAATRVVAGDDTLVAACTTDEFTACATCLADEPDGACEACAGFADTQFDLCQRAYAYEGATLYVNPRLSLRDISPEEARVLGPGTCEQPEALAEQLSSYVAENPTAPQDLKCTSPLQPQPLEPAAATVSSADIGELEGLERADVVELRTLQFDVAQSLEPIVSVTTHDARALSETVTVTFEGVLPRSARADGVLDTEAQDDGSIWIDVGMNNCSTGVQVGDRLVIPSTPARDCEIEGDLEFDIVEVDAGTLRIAPLDEDGAATEVPTRSCFETAIAYEVRPSQQWTVVGSVLGYLSGSTSAFGECLPRYGAARIDARVASDELFRGPYYSLYLYPGYAPEAVTPVRDTSFSFQFANGFQPLQHPTCGSLSQQCAPGVFPTDVVWIPDLPFGTLLVSPDPNDNFVHVRNLDDAAAGYAVIR